VIIPAAIIDFETEPILGHKPPKPVGVAIDRAYFAWGHPCENNSTETIGKRMLSRVFGSFDTELWAFNAGFDFPVAAAHLGLKTPWHRVRDVQILAFLADPLSTARDLKSLAEQHAGVKHGERNEMYEWIKTNIPEAKRLGPAKLGAFISRAPGNLVGRYAVGDTRDTRLLRDKWDGAWRGTQAYEREHALLPVLDDMRRCGIPIARKRLERDAQRWEGWLSRCDDWLMRRLRLKDLKPRMIVAACEALGLVEEWILTPKNEETGRGGTPSLAGDALDQLVREGLFHDKKLVEVWGYRTYLGWILKTFVRPWLASGGERVHPAWNGVRQERGGAVTGRLSSTPNVQNMPKPSKIPTFKLPRGLEVGPIPNLRLYVEAPEGWTYVGIDISQQEFRILGHYVPSIGDRYRENPKTDFHNVTSKMIEEVAHIKLIRDYVKVVNFCRIYGGGALAVSRQARVSYEQAEEFVRMHKQAFPGIETWDWEMHRKGEGSVIPTVGGRKYPTVPDKSYRDKNYAIQGSAADQLKALMIAIHPEVKNLGGWIPLTAHDEILTCVPTRAARETKRILLEAVEDTGVGGPREMFDVPMLGETYQGKRWVK